MSIRELPRKAAATSAPTESIFTNVLGKPRVRVAEDISEDYLRKRLKTLWSMGIPAGPAGNKVYEKRQRDIAAAEKRLRDMEKKAYDDE